jgi:hypothetical protein
MKIRRLALTVVMLAASIVLPVFYTQPAAAMVIEASLEDLVRDSDVILIGTVEQVLNSRIDDTRIGVHTDIIVKPSQYLYGQTDGRNIAVRIEGGVKGEITVWAEDQPEFIEGESILLFLRLASTYEDVTPPAGIDHQNYFRTVGAFQGKWDYLDGTAVDSRSRTYNISEIGNAIADIHGNSNDEKFLAAGSAENTPSARQDYTWIYITGIALAIAGTAALAIVLRRHNMKAD